MVWCRCFMQRTYIAMWASMCVVRRNHIWCRSCRPMLDHEAQLAPQPGDVMLLIHESLPPSHKQTMWGTCHVPGCSKSLTGLRDFHQRFQVCDDHIKACPVSAIPSSELISPIRFLFRASFCSGKIHRIMAVNTVCMHTQGGSLASQLRVC